MRIDGTVTGFFCLSRSMNCSNGEMPSNFSLRTSGLPWVWKTSMISSDWLGAGIERYRGMRVPSSPSQCVKSASFTNSRTP